MVLGISRLDLGDFLGRLSPSHGRSRLHLSSFEYPRTARSVGGGRRGGLASGGFEGCCVTPGSGLGRKPLIEGTLELYSESRQVSSPSLNNRLQQKSTGQSRSETVLLSTSQLLPLEDYVRPSDTGAKKMTDGQNRLYKACGIYHGLRSHHET